VEALKGVSLSVSVGEIIGIIGKSGAGKSTLLRCLSLLEKPDEGDLVMNGLSLIHQKDDRMRQIRRNIGVVFQSNPLLKQSTVFDNVAYPLRLAGWSISDITQRVKDLLDLIQLSDKAQAYPATLSGGQRQRVAIARALAAKPQVLLLDEPTSALDSVTTRQLIHLLKTIHAQTHVAILIITHELTVVEALCERVLVLDDGAVVESGPTAQVFAAPSHPVTQELLGFQERYD
jgi:D-methionine transport system ATP-binding protein